MFLGGLLVTQNLGIKAFRKVVADVAHVFTPSEKIVLNVTIE